MDPRARKIVSYADISPDAPAEPEPAAEPPNPGPSRPSKRPRTSSSQSHTSAAPPVGSFTSKVTNGNGFGTNGATQQPQHEKKKQKKDPKAWKTSRTLTHEEIWDDSALIGAWDAAMEEYRALNGAEKGWMEQPTKDSALWWNTQPEEEEEEEEGEDEDEDQDEDEDPYGQDEPLPTARGEEYAAYPSAPGPAGPVHPSSSAGAGVPALPGTSVPFLPSSALPPTAVPADPDKVLEMAIQSYYWAGYLMGRRDEMMRAGTGGKTEEKRVVQQAVVVDGANGVDDEDMLFSETDGAQ